MCFVKKKINQHLQKQSFLFNVLDFELKFQKKCYIWFLSQWEISNQEHSASNSDPH